MSSTSAWKWQNCPVAACRWSPARPRARLPSPCPAPTRRSPPPPKPPLGPMSGYLALRYRGHIHWPLLLRQVLPLMAVGTGLGHGLKPLLGRGALQGVFGVLIIGFAVRALWQRGQAEAAHGSLRMPTLLFGAGLTHGLFASGGPLLVLALAGRTLPKAALRSTLIVVWFSLNSLLTVIYCIEGSLLPALPRTLSYLPVVLCGLLAGEWLHHRVDEARFRQLVHGLLAVVGGALLLTA